MRILSESKLETISQLSILREVLLNKENSSLQLQEREIACTSK